MSNRGERTEKPSAKRLKEARERGRVARSHDLSVALASLAATAMLVAYGSWLLSRLSETVSEGLARLGTDPLRPVTADELTTIVVQGGVLLVMVVGPLAAVAAAGGVIAAAAQGGFAVAPKAFRLDWERLSPTTGLARFAPSRSGVETLKAIVIAASLAMVAWRAGVALTADAPRLLWMPTTAAAHRGWDIVLQVLWQAQLALLVVGAADYAVQRWRLHTSLKMTRQEAKDEARSSEGNPEIKGRVRRVQREMARRRMLHAVRHATVVVTNPTHYAVALEYARDKAPAPLIVAKGRDLVAERIREIARTHGVPIVENPPLARALFQSADVGEMIPSPLFGAVAEVLAYLVRIKQLML